MIMINERAIAHLEHICKTQNCDAVRLEVVGGGCSGFSYKWSTISEEDIAEKDLRLPLDDHFLVIDSLTEMYLSGAKIDYPEEIWGAKLEIDNPNVMGGCGCGESFTIQL